MRVTTRRLLRRDGRADRGSSRRCAVVGGEIVGRRHAAAGGGTPTSTSNPSRRAVFGENSLAAENARLTMLLHEQLGVARSSAAAVAELRNSWATSRRAYEARIRELELQPTVARAVAASAHGDKPLPSAVPIEEPTSTPYSTPPTFELPQPPTRRGWRWRARASAPHRPTPTAAPRRALRPTPTRPHARPHRAAPGRRGRLGLPPSEMLEPRRDDGGGHRGRGVAAAVRRRVRRHDDRRRAGDDGLLTSPSTAARRTLYLRPPYWQVHSHHTTIHTAQRTTTDRTGASISIFIKGFRGERQRARARVCARAQVRTVHLRGCCSSSSLGAVRRKPMASLVKRYRSPT